MRVHYEIRGLHQSDKGLKITNCQCGLQQMMTLFFQKRKCVNFVRFTFSIIFAKYAANLLSMKCFNCLEQMCPKRMLIVFCHNQNLIREDLAHNNRVLCVPKCAGYNPLKCVNQKDFQGTVVVMSSLRDEVHARLRQSEFKFWPQQILADNSQVLEKHSLYNFKLYQEVSHLRYFSGDYTKTRRGWCLRIG